MGALARVDNRGSSNGEYRILSSIVAMNGTRATKKKLEKSMTEKKNRCI